MKEFDATATEKEKIDVLLVEPGKPPRPYRIGTELEDLQAAVGGYIQVVYPFDEKVGIICNDEGKLIGLPLNRALRDEKGEIYDILTGNFLITGLTEESFGSLTPDQMERYEKRFHLPEIFVKMGKGIMAVPLEKDDGVLTAEGKPTEVAKKSPPAQDAR
ncbi:MAG: DUF3846 domain-containing protein [Clostridiales bacterium]|nr:DUF3846 domain-containing protein [Clostridiales bacterium]